MKKCSPRENEKGNIKEGARDLVGCERGEWESCLRPVSKCLVHTQRGVNISIRNRNKCGRMAEHPDLDALDLFIQEKGIPPLQTGYCADGNAVGQQEAFVLSSGVIWLKIKVWVRLDVTV